MKKLFLAIIMLATGLIVTACGGNANDQIVLEFFNLKPELNNILQEIADDFNYENPNIVINITGLSDAAIVLRSRMASNDAPDITHVWIENNDYREWAADGRFLNLNEEAFLNNITAGVPEEFAINGNVYAVPLTMSMYGIWYNTTAFQELGIAAPQTWQEMEQIVEQINRAGYIPFATSLSTPAAGSINGFHQLLWMTVAGGFAEAQELLIGSEIDGLTMDDPYLLQVAQRLSLVANNSQLNSAGASVPDAIASFSSGESLMLPGGSWNSPTIALQNPEFEVGMFPVPGENRNEGLAIGALDISLAISADIPEERQEAAKKFIAYFTEVETMQRVFEVDGDPVSVIGVETEFPDREGIATLAFTDRQVPWLHSIWLTEEEFASLTVDFMNSGNLENFVSDINSFLNLMRD